MGHKTTTKSKKKIRSRHKRQKDRLCSANSKQKKRRKKCLQKQKKQKKANRERNPQKKQTTTNNSCGFLKWCAVFSCWGGKNTTNNNWECLLVLWKKGSKTGRRRKKGSKLKKKKKGKVGCFLGRNSRVSLLFSNLCPPLISVCLDEKPRRSWLLFFFFVVTVVQQKNKSGWIWSILPAVICFFQGLSHACARENGVLLFTYKEEKKDKTEQWFCEWLITSAIISVVQQGPPQKKEEILRSASLVSFWREKGFLFDWLLALAGHYVFRFCLQGYPSQLVG